jgi:gamma-glutamylcyclotransferase (GGCT)/AIG2-like uncharacterized protein YtfP
MENHNNPPVAVFAYGSLKEGYHIFDRFESIRSVQKNVSISGFKMYNLGSYPCIAYTGNDEDVVHGEVVLLDPKESVQLDHVELGAGYYADTRQIGDHICKVYVTRPDNHQYLKGQKHIESGIWEYDYSDNF